MEKELEELRIRQGTEPFAMNSLSKKASMKRNQPDENLQSSMGNSNHTLGEIRDQQVEKRRVVMKKRVAKEDVDHIGHYLENKMVANRISLDELQEVRYE